MDKTQKLPPAVRELAEAIRLTREYVGEEMLPPIEGWSWYDALRRWAPQYLPQEIADQPERASEDQQEEMPADQVREGITYVKQRYGYDGGGHAEPAPLQSASEQVRDLERIIERVREAVGTDQPVAPCEQHHARIASLENALLEMLTTLKSEITQRQIAGTLSLNTIRKWWNAADGVTA